MTNELLDARQISDLIGLVYGSALEEPQWQGLVRRLTELCPGHVASVATFDNSDSVYAGAAGLPGGERQAKIEKLRRTLRDGGPEPAPDLHTVLASRVRIELGNIVCTRDAFTDEELHGFETYRRDMAPVGAGHWTAMHYSISETRRAAIMVVENDWQDGPKDNATVRELLELISPHAIRAARMARALTLAREASETYRGFVDAIALPFVVVDSEGDIQVTNSAAERLLDSGTLIAQSTRGRLELRGVNGIEGLKGLLKAASAAAEPRGTRLRSGTSALSLCVAPFRASMALGTEIDRRIHDRQDLFAVFVGAPHTGSIHADLLRDVFSLSPREAKVCEALADGKGPADIAAEAGRSERTVRNQIQSIHEKIGVTSNRQLIDALAVFRTIAAMTDGESVDELSVSRVTG